MDVQRLSDSLGVKPQAYGGRKILTLIIKGLEIVFTLGNASGILYVCSIRVASNRKIMDALNVFHIINEAFFIRANQIFNPRNAMYISRNNGSFNLDACVQRDTLINANTLMHLGRKNYNKDQLNKLRMLKQKTKEHYQTA